MLAVLRGTGWRRKEPEAGKQPGACAVVTQSGTRADPGEATTSLGF